MKRRLPAPVRRELHRVAYVGLVVVSRLLHPRTRGVKCVLVAEGEVLLARHAYGPNRWDLPGGFCRPREDPEAAARREVSEELAVTGARWTATGELETRRHGRHETLYLFRVDVAERALEADRGELAEVRWCDPAALPEPRSDIVDDAVARALAAGAA